MPGLDCRLGFSFSSCGGRGSSLAAVCGPLPAEAALVSTRELSGVRTSAVPARGLRDDGSGALDHRLSSRDAQAWLLRGKCGFSGSELQPTSPALAGGFFTPEPPRKPLQVTIRPFPFTMYTFLDFMQYTKYIFLLIKAVRERHFSYFAVEAYFN